MNAVLKFYNLETWKLARVLRNDIAKLVKNFPDTEKFRLIDQIIRSSRSVTANIAEGFGRFHYQESAHFYRQARGSLTETVDHLICAFDQQYISKVTLQQFLDRFEECGRLLNGLIRSQSTHAKK